MASGVAVYAVSFSPVSCPSIWRDKTWCLIFSPLERWDSPCHPSSHFQTATPTSDHRTKNVCRGEAGQKNRTGSVWSACTPALSTMHPEEDRESMLRKMSSRFSFCWTVLQSSEELLCIQRFQNTNEICGHECCASVLSPLM